MDRRKFLRGLSAASVMISISAYAMPKKRGRLCGMIRNFWEDCGRRGITYGLIPIANDDPYLIKTSQGPIMFTGPFCNPKTMFLWENDMDVLMERAGLRVDRKENGPSFFWCKNHWRKISALTFWVSEKKDATMRQKEDAMKARLHMSNMIKEYNDELEDFQKAIITGIGT